MKEFTSTKTAGLQHAALLEMILIGNDTGNDFTGKDSFRTYQWRL